MKIDLGKITIAVAALAAGVVLGIGILTLRNREIPAPIRIVPPEPTQTSSPTMTPSPMQVFVSGEVLFPDVYGLAPGSRIKQLVEAAGGFTDNANTTAVNMAQPLADGVHVHIPAEGDPVSTPNSVLTEPARLPNSGENDLGVGGGVININTAELQELETLPGIGPVTAQKIIDYRAANGAFPDIAAIMEVSGIGQGMFDKIDLLISIGN